VVGTEILVIGGGAAGLMAAIAAAEAGADVTVVEKKSLCGRKIAITGKGRCNLTNMRDWHQFKEHIHPDPKPFKSAFKAFDNRATVDFFERIGLPTELTRGERVFPKSMKAQDVVSVLLSRAKSLGVKIYNDVDIISVERSDNVGYISKFLKTSQSEATLSLSSINSKAVIVATGGLSYPLTGSTGKGYEIASSFGHKIVTCFPSLTALKPVKYDQRLIDIELKNVGLVLYVDGRPVQIEQGELQFTSGGIEGSIGYRVSRKAVWALINGAQVELVIDLKPALSTSQIAMRLERECQQLQISPSTANKKLNRLLRTMLPEALIIPFISSFDKIDYESLPSLLKDWRFKINDYVKYERAVVTAGGVDLKEVDMKSMQSKKAPGLFFAGELLNLDGDTGGYNLQIAFSTGVLAGCSAADYNALG
jgi:predicted Rossmann fold flavoprotein